MSKKDNMSDVFETRSNTEKCFKWKYGFRDSITIIKDFFRGPQKSVRHNTFAETAETLMEIISSGEGEMLREDIDKILVESEKLLKQQRITDDTWARRRLEKWATRVIAWYLILVFFLIVATGIFHITGEEIDFISDQVMIVVLSTTTINIIGLGVIVLKGHFYKESKKD